MVSAINSALSGFAAATTRLNVSASNIANAFSTQTTQDGQTVNSPYVPQDVVQTSQPGGGVIATTQNANPASVTVYDPTNPAADAQGTVQAPNVDPAQQLVQAKVSTYDAQANLNVLKVQNETTSDLLNIIS